MAKSASDMWSHCSNRSMTLRTCAKLPIFRSSMKFAIPRRFLKMTRCSPLQLRDFLHGDREGDFLSGHLCWRV